MQKVATRENITTPTTCVSAPSLCKQRRASLRDSLRVLRDSEFIETLDSAQAMFGNPDVLISSGSYGVAAHRKVLLEASPVFSSMLQCGMREDFEAKIDIPDISSETLDSFVDFLYTSKLPSDKTTLEELLALAHMYNTPALMCACVVEFLEWIGFDNEGREGSKCFGLALSDEDHNEHMKAIWQHVVWELENDPVLFDELLQEAIMRI
jgi:hypothetical protein